tara:strand:+ start:892 stop:1305 length:414 start_codon:yes stop_codon:yes gene_type:complete
MQTQENTPETAQKREAESSKETWTVKSLPTLSDADRKLSLDFENRQWALNFANPANVGKINTMTSQGIILQNVGSYSVRCIFAFDHFDTRIGLAMVRNTFVSVGIDFEVGEVTVIVPYTPEDEIAPTEAVAPGVEVC